MMINLNQGRKYKQLNKGITLVALVVTIVVLLILAGISINLLLGENGIIKKAKEAREKTAEGKTNDMLGMNQLIQDMYDLENSENKKENDKGDDKSDEVKKYKVTIQFINRENQSIVNFGSIEIYEGESIGQDAKQIATISGKNETENVISLAKGTYTVRCLKAPEGYEKRAEYITFNVDENDENKWKIEVTKGSRLPSTGDSSIYNITVEDGSSNISTKGVQSLTVQYEGRSGVKLEIIPIGEYDENTKKIVVDDEIASILGIKKEFDSSIVDSSKAEDVYQYVKKKGLVGAYSTTNSDGRSTFSELEPNIYFVKTSLSSKCDFVISMPLYVKVPDVEVYYNSVTLTHEKRGTDKEDDYFLGITDNIEQPIPPTKK